MKPKNKNVTFTLPNDVVDKLREYVKENYIPSLNAGVKEALEEYTVKIEKMRFKIEMEQAAKDQMFLDDISNTMKEYETIDKESDRRSEKW